MSGRSLVGAAIVGVGVGAVLWGASLGDRKGSRNLPVLLEPMLDVWTALHAQQDLYQSLHWKASGSSSYGDHLLYERLYKGRLEELDQVAERIVGLFGEEALDARLLVKRSAAWLSRWVEARTPVEQALAAEADLQRVLQRVRKLGVESGALTLGLDDLIAGLASAHEGSVYLLQQRAKQGAAGGGSKNVRVPLSQAVALAQDAWGAAQGVVGVGMGRGAISVRLLPGVSTPFPAMAWGWPVRVRSAARPRAS